MLKQFKTFSAEYARGVSALVSMFILAIAIFSLWYVKREFGQKYRPYVVAQVTVEPIADSKRLAVFIAPRSLGEHPCEFRLSNIILYIGDEPHTTPDINEWILMAPRVEHLIPAGYVSEIGIMRVREARYRNNIIEVAFDLHTRSVEQEFEDIKTFRYEINVLTESPIVFMRPGLGRR